jgi:hypothetical protein
MMVDLSSLSLDDKDPVMVVPCDECEKPGASRCGICLSGWCCSRGCQKKAWPIHKVLCKTLKGFRSRPAVEKSNEKYTRAIYFHPFEGTPRFVWLKTDRIVEDDCENFHIRSADLVNDETEAESEGGYVVHSES